MTVAVWSTKDVSQMNHPSSDCLWANLHWSYLLSWSIVCSTIILKHARFKLYQHKVHYTTLSITQFLGHGSSVYKPFSSDMSWSDVRFSYLITLALYLWFSMPARKIGKVWSILWCNDYVSATISATVYREGGRYMYLHHKINQAFPIFLHAFGRPGYKAR